MRAMANFNLSHSNLRLYLLKLFLSYLMIKGGFAMINTHFKCRGGLYPKSNVERFPVSDNEVSWTTNYDDYNPRNYTSSSIEGKPWADPEIGDPIFKPNWNTLDGNVNRRSYMGNYEIRNGVPLNPIGRTGIIGRGVCGRWGPNHAADSVVTRWKKLESGAVAKDENNKPILQFISIKRGDSGEWAIPGGMVDPGERVVAAAVREFEEEASNSFAMSDGEKEALRARYAEFFSHGEEVYRGYVDDPRNTDNSWLETIAYNFHDEDGSVVGSLRLQAGDDAVGVHWVDITPDIKLYASHEVYVLEVLKRRMAALA